MQGNAEKTVRELRPMHYTPLSPPSPQPPPHFLHLGLSVSFDVDPPTYCENGAPSSTRRPRDECRPVCTSVRSKELLGRFPVGLRWNCILARCHHLDRTMLHVTNLAKPNRTNLASRQMSPVKLEVDLPERILHSIYTSKLMPLSTRVCLVIQNACGFKSC